MATGKKQPELQIENEASFITWFKSQEKVCTATRSLLLSWWTRVVVLGRYLPDDCHGQAVHLLRETKRVQQASAG